MTLLEKVLTQYPDMKLDETGTPNGKCPSAYGGTNINCADRTHCFECWLQEYVPTEREILQAKIETLNKQIEDMKPHLNKTCFTCLNHLKNTDKCASCFAGGYSIAWECKW